MGERLIWIGVIVTLAVLLLLAWNRAPAAAPRENGVSVVTSGAPADPVRGGAGPSAPLRTEVEAGEEGGTGAQEAGAETPAVDSDTIRRTKWLVRTELDSFREQLVPLEAKAGDSPAAYLDFLRMQLRLIMREDALKSVEAGRLQLVPDSTANPKDLFDGGSYVMFSTGPARGAVQGMVAVPMIREADIAAMREAIAQTRDTVISDFVLMFNSESEQRRAELRSQFERTGTMEGMPEAVRENQTRLKWSENGCLLRDQK
ncbi:MAG: hypothetical protein KAI24_00295 [Planctomycetes bacterium]|nr:hypothetical protein [Planctomycetota bacterium]